MNDSLQQVHSRPWSQITGIRGLVSIASTTFGTSEAGRPRAAAVIEQNRTNVLRSTPCAFSSPYVVGRSKSPIAASFRNVLIPSCCRIMTNAPARIYRLFDPYRLIQTNRSEERRV